MKKRKIVIRLLVSPFILGLLLVTYIYSCFKHFIGFIRFGGEWITYQKDDTKRLEAIFKLLKEQQSNKLA